MKKIFLFIFLSSSSLTGAQSLSEAHRLFDRYEYVSASKMYEDIGRTKKLDLESSKNLAYSYYVSGSFKKCYPLVDSLIKLPDTEPFFWYAHGVSAMEEGHYDISKRSLLKYKSMDDEYEVDVLIGSCDSLKVWKKIENVEIIAYELNNSKADINGVPFNDGYFVYREIGIDSSGVEVKTENADGGELVLARPLWINSDNQATRISLPSKYKFTALTSIASLNGKEQFLLTLTEPSSEDFVLRLPHLYVATWNGEGSFENIAPWIYSGIEDTSACAYATVTEDGERVIFTKQGRMTNGADLYTSIFENGSWSKPLSFEALNTPYDEMFPLISGDSVLVFSSNGRPGYGALDLYKVSFNGMNFGRIEHLKAPINSSRDDFNFTWLNDSSAMFTSNRSDGSGDDDIYKVIFPKVPSNEGDSTTKTEEQDYISNWSNKKIYFDYDKFSIRDQNIIEDIALALKKFEGVKIVIEGHTDSRGDEKYNLELGKQRARTVYNEFVKLGVDSKDLDIVSKGESDPLIDCGKGCTDMEHQQNRVAIIKLIVD